LVDKLITSNFATLIKNVINRPAKILVTGGTGFLGAYIIKELVDRQYEVRATRRNKLLPFFIAPDILDRVEWFDGDILDVVSLEEAMQGVDAVVHAAAKVSFRANDRDEMFRTNIEGTANVVNLAIEQQVSKFIYISSVAAIGRVKNGDTVNEKQKWQDSPLNTNYAISKYHAEMEVWRGMGEGLNVTVVNPSTILGYGDWNSSSCALFKNVYQEFPWYTTGVNGFVDVEDVARAVVMLLDAPSQGERFILNGDNWSFQQLFNQIAAGFSKKPPHREATSFLAELAWRMDKLKSLLTGKPSLLTKESARVSQTRTYFDNHKILDGLPGFNFTPLSETIAKACKEYLNSPQTSR
jgi:dihydroflavonol-4-reductase